MIRSLSGTVQSVGTYELVLDVRGVGYLVHTDAFRHGYQPGEAFTLHTHLAVRETALDLYGFRHHEELRLFELLLTVPKIGPKLALQVLCQADRETLVRAIVEQEPTALSRLSGIGKKTAELIVSNLHDTLEREAVPFTSGETETGATTQSDALDALIALGFTRDAARQAIRSAPEGVDTATIIRSALRGE